MQLSYCDNERFVYSVYHLPAKRVNVTDKHRSDDYVTKKSTDLRLAMMFIILLKN